MISSKSGKRIKNLRQEKLVREIDAINEAIYPDRSLGRSSVSRTAKNQVSEAKSKISHGGEEAKDKKSIWNWKPLKALSHIRNRRFNCSFSLQVHSIECLPPPFKGINLRVHWKRRDGELLTRSARVSEGRVEFEEELTTVCSVYGSRSGPHHSAKYEAKHFLVFASICEAPEVDLGKHRVDLTRLLPLTLEELEEDRGSGKWSTSYKLSGKGKGAVLNVSFMYSVLGHKSMEDQGLVQEILTLKNSQLSKSFDPLYRKLNEQKVVDSSEVNLSKFGHLEQKLDDDPSDGNTLSLKNSELSKSVELVNHKHEKQDFVDSSDVNPSKSREWKFDYPSKEIMKNTDENGGSFGIKLSKSENFGSPSTKRGGLFEEYVENIETHQEDKRDESKESLMKELKSALENVSSLEDGLDDDTEAVENEFLHMLGLEECLEGEPESPRERLLRQFESETLASGSSLFNFEFDVPKISPKEMDDFETKKLMREWGLSEKAFEPDGPSSSIESGDLFEDNIELPSLGEGLGGFVHTKDGGFLRSMDPKIFSDAKNGGSLIMQVSRPVVVPAEMGSGVEDILQRLASVGVENLSMHANSLMPLGDITGMTMQQLAWENSQRLIAHDSEPMLKSDPCGNRSPRPRALEGSEYVSLEELAPSAIEKIEALSMEGLRIQSGMPSEDAPLNITGDQSAALRLPNVNADTGTRDSDGLMGLSLTLDEWVKLDSGQIDPESDRTSKILAAHHANRAGLRRKRGLLGNNLTIALMVQLRDPFRDYEPVGVPMLALVQVERVLDPPKTRIYRTVSDPDDITEEKDERVPMLKVAEIHVVGLKTDTCKPKVWGTMTQQQAGSRWLLANGMGKCKKDPIVKPKGFVGPRMETGDSLWSISAKIAGKIRGFSGLGSHKRNPDILL